MPDVMPLVAIMQPVFGIVPSSCCRRASMNWFAVLAISVDMLLYVYLRLNDPFAIYIGTHRSG